MKNLHLTPKQAAEGIVFIQNNANELLSDAEILFQNGRYERSTDLSILAIEEIAKVSIIRAILVSEQKDLKNEWKSFRSHTDKNWFLIFLNHVKGSGDKLETFKNVFKDSEGKQRIEDFKQSLIYVNHGAKGWSLPKTHISKDVAESIINAAKYFVNTDEEVMASEPELQLWVKHLKPVWKQDMETMKAALLNCYKEAQELGVLKGRASSNDMKEFLF
jgi:AbiV family abortive infection protein